MRIYTAAPFGSYERVRRLNDALRTVGHTVTHDWTRTEEFGDDGHPLPAPDGSTDGGGLAGEVKARHAADDLRGVRTADLVLYLADEGPSYGSCIEVGAAIAYGIPVWLVAPQRFTIFWGLPTVRLLESEDEAREQLGIGAVRL